ncbi:MAG: rifampicin phosphotransferase, partial [Solirubrobacteraceae bacterium]|nr:rifampicin phosphotransferase [Solirubrobacteraceae bacterium]
RLDEGLVCQTIGILSVMQPLHDAVVQLCEKLGAGDASVLTGASGGAEMAVVNDIWAASRGRLSVEEIVRRHGFHGPLEGELSGRPWREDPAPLRAMIEGYRARPDGDDPALRDAGRRRARPAAERELLDAAPVWQRPAIRRLLALAREKLPLRGVGKRSFLQAVDVGRAAARRVGALLAADGVLDDPEDVFYLTFEELTGTLPADPKAVVAERRARRIEYQALQLPDAWKGMVEPFPEQDAVAVDVIEGIGVSAGVVEGVARVLHDPDFEDVEDGEILVAPFTDPGWASIMFLSAALVVDIGGALSHAAVVAREMDIPCVVNTRTGTRDLHTGDRVRVDGKAGTVEILSRSGATPTPSTPPA